MIKKNGENLSVVRIPRGMLEVVDESIRAKQAKRLGPDSKSDVER